MAGENTTEELSTAAQDAKALGANPDKPLTPAARRALEEAEARRAASAQEADRPVEKGGPKGPEPTRFGDWEKGGRAYDF